MPAVTMLEMTRGRRGRRWLKFAAALFVLAAAATYAVLHSSSHDQPAPLDSGAVSPPGYVCGVLDRRDVGLLTGVRPQELHEESSRNTYPTSRKSFYGISCTVLDESDPQRELVGLEVETVPLDDYVSMRRREMNSIPGSTRLLESLGEGMIAPRTGGYLVRSCPQGGSYLIRANTQVGAGTAEQWVTIFEETVPRVDLSGACSSKRPES
jgi:hypothetical protein